MNEIVIIPEIRADLVAYVDHSELNEQAQAYYNLGKAGAKNTLRGTVSDLKLFKLWCEENFVDSVPISLTGLVQYITHLANERSWFTIQRHLISIKKLHKASKTTVPFAATHDDFKIFMLGLKRSKSIKQNQAPAFTLDDLRRAISAQPETVSGLRNRVILLLGYTGAFRRGELSALDIENLLIDSDGMIISMNRSKTNQYGAIEEKSVRRASEAEYCPIRTVKNYVELLGRTTGPLFVRIGKGMRITADRLSDHSINTIIKHILGGDFTAHSMRASFVTITKENGADDREIMNQTKHKSTMMIERYDRRRNIRKNNASNKAGL